MAPFTPNELGGSHDGYPAVTETPTRGPLTPLGKEPMASALSSYRERGDAKPQYAKVSDHSGRLSDGTTLPSGTTTEKAAPLPAVWDRE